MNESLDLVVGRTRTTLAQYRAFAVVGPSDWNDLPFSQWAKLMTGFSQTASETLTAYLIL